ncbi:MAG TPA: CocE/NonD family hydrolase [Streptosporangiaceae bacterium]|nr:CocE/NonD family hydrolase [Streptosporangiaceae bacterium]
MTVREARISMRDGTELAATLYLPAQPVTTAVPALLEYLPYRKDDAMLARDYELYAYMTRHGYAGARVDIRGTGNSGGDLPEGEYTEQEQRDAEDVIAWLAAQPWCTGAVGMWGISWGGFNAIQVALRRPPALKAIIAVDASDDLFHDDVHYIDGLLHLDEYALMIDHMNALPPAPDFPLDSATLARRFDSEPWLATWLARQQDGTYWRRASLRPDYDRLTIPAFLIGGWYDGYRDSVPRMLAAVPAPVKIMIGPWNHTFPHNAVPGPAVEWRADAVRWWDHWLKGAENGIMSEPPVTVYVRDWHPPDPDLAEIPGRWRTETAFPPERTAYWAWYCGPEGNLPADPPQDGAVALRYVASAGVEAGHWWGELTVDQRGADAFSLVFDSPPLAEEAEILGFPLVELHGSSDAEPLHWFGRLCDVAPDGTVTLVTGGGRAGRPDPQRDGGSLPGSAIPAAKSAPSAQSTPITQAALPLELHVTSWVFPRGHRIRLALSNAMWPMIWPTPRSATATVRLGPDGTRLVLPVVPAADRPAPVFAEPGPAEHPPGVRHRGEMLPVRWTLQRDDTGTTAIWWRGSTGTEFPWGRVADEEYLRYSVHDARPASASAHGEARTEIHLDGRLLIATSVLDLDSDDESLRYSYRREMRCDGMLIRERGWQRRYPRDGH